MTAHEWCDDEQCADCEARWDAGERPPAQDHARGGKCRTCTRCGHEECPCCDGWCDRLLHTESEGGHIPDSERDANGVPLWPALCCGGACVFEDGVPR